MGIQRQEDPRPVLRRAQVPLWHLRLLEPTALISVGLSNSRFLVVSLRRIVGVFHFMIGVTGQE